ncbi:MAG: hypothetical protein PVH19_01295 [Planctomycetia bacterium]|jgi:hypothetical protein
MTIPENHTEREILARKRVDLFAVSLTAFIAVNCLSYFVRSGMGGLPLNGFVDGVWDVIGFPFLALEFHKGGAWRCFWYALAADLSIAFLTSWLIAKFRAKKMPFQIREEAVSLRHSRQSLLVLMFCITASALVAWYAPGLREGIRDGLFFLGPIVVGTIWVTVRRLPWSWLGIAGAWLFLLATAVALYPFVGLLHYHLVHLMDCVVSAFVPIGGILSIFALLFTMFRLLRHLDKLAEQAREWVPEKEED